MSGNLNSFRAKLNTLFNTENKHVGIRRRTLGADLEVSFKSLSSEQFNALYEEICKEYVRRLLEKEAAKTGTSVDVHLSTDLRLLDGYSHVLTKSCQIGENK